MNFMNVHKLTNVFKNFSLLQSSPSPSPKKASEATTAAAEDATMDFTAGAESKVEADLTVKSAAAEVEEAFSGVAASAAASDVVKVEEEGEVMVDVEEKDNRDESATKEDEKEDLKAAPAAAATAAASLPPPPAPAKAKVTAGVGTIVGSSGGSSSGIVGGGRRTRENSERSDEGDEGGIRPTRRLRGKKEGEQPVAGAALSDSDSLLENKRLSRYITVNM